MQKSKYGFCFLFLVMCMQTVMAQTYNTGDKLEALVGNAWKPVTVIKVVAGNPNFYEVKTIATNNNRGAAVTSITVNKTNLRRIIQNPDEPAKTVVPESNIHLGRYELYSGIPTMYIGHIIMMAGGKYKVAFDTDENNYAQGTYAFHPETNTIEWISGMFKNNNWGGKLVAKPGSGFRIEFNKASYADSN